MNNSNFIKRWHIFISGYTQNRQQSTGLQKCWLDAQSNYNKDNKNPHNCCFFPVLPWNYDWYTLARFIQINSNFAENHNEPPKINIYAYSWGAGYGATQLAKNLQKVANYNVQTMVLADPVACAGFAGWKAIFAGRYAITRRFAPIIQIPKNIRNVYWSRQYNNWPRAHSLHSSSSKTKIHSPHLESSLIHAEMDDSPWFQDKVKEFTSA